jgi:ParB/RepB/Spo0J family partition protein
MAPATTTAAPIFERIDLEKIFPDPDQPRQTFDDEALGELAVSIKENGVVVPIKVRPHPKKNHGSFMLVAGERRWRASKLAGVSDIPAVIEILDDTQALEHQILENSQRVDVPPLEEAEAYQSLLDDHRYTMDRLVEKTGRSKAHLYGRLKLLGLAPGAKKALQAGELAPAIAELVARIPDVKLQEQATKQILGKGDNWRAYNEAGVSGEHITDEKQERTSQPLSFRASVQLIRRRYQTQFDLLKFDPVDQTLVAKAGACTNCPHRAGNQPALPGLTPPKGVDDDYCTMPSCFESKVEASFAAKAQLAKSQGLKVIEGAAAKKILPYHNGQVANDSSYVDAKSELPYELAKPGSRATYGSLLGKKLQEVPRVLVQDPNTGVARELLVKDKAIEALREFGKIDKASKKSSSSTKADRKKENEREKKKHALHEATIRRVLEQVATNAAKDPGGKELAMWRWLGRAFVGEHGGNEHVEERRGVELKQRSGGGFAGLFEAAKTIADVRSLLVEYLIAESADRGTGSYPNTYHKKIFEDGCKVFGADWDKAADAAKAAYEAEQKSDAAKDAKKAPAKGKVRGGAK